MERSIPRPFRWMILCLVLASFTAGCGSSDSNTAPEQEVSRSRDVSSVPWTKPASWEGGSVGGVNPGLNTQ